MSRVVGADPEQSRPIQGNPGRSRAIPADPERSRPIQGDPNESKIVRACAPKDATRRGHVLRIFLGGSMMG
jgi:hypothetical protein